MQDFSLIGLLRSARVPQLVGFEPSLLARKAISEQVMGLKCFFLYFTIGVLSRLDGKCRSIMPGLPQLLGVASIKRLELLIVGGVFY